MKNLFLKLINKINLIITFFLFINFSALSADIYNEIKVKGNKRLSVETIIMFSGLKTGLELSNDDLNTAIKNLYETDYFKNVEILIFNQSLEINIDENPIIQSIKINGVKNKSILEEIKKITRKSEKYPFLKNKVEDQKNILLNIVRSNGFYVRKIKTI